MTSKMLDKLNLGTPSNAQDKSNKVQAFDAKKILNTLSDSKTIIFTGAGFSKAWNNSYPTGLELFAIDNIENEKENYNFFKLAEELGIREPSQPGSDLSHNMDDEAYQQTCYEYFKNIKLHLDIYKRYPSLMPSYLDSTLINSFEDEIRDYIKARFERITPPDAFNINSIEDGNKNIVSLFKYLLQKCSSLGFISTNYDFIIEKAFNNIGDINLIRGVVDNNQFCAKSWGGVKVPLLKINGGFEVKFNKNEFFIDYENTCTFSPQIILPSKDQNYSNKYYKSTFIKSAQKLRDANSLIFIGYSMPDEDHTIQFLLRNFIEGETEGKQIFIIGRNKDSAKGPANKVHTLFSELSDKEAIYVLDGDINDLCHEISPSS